MQQWGLKEVHSGLSRQNYYFMTHLRELKRDVPGFWRQPGWAGGSRANGGSKIKWGTLKQRVVERNESTSLASTKKKKNGKSLSHKTHICIFLLQEGASSLLTANISSKLQWGRSQKFSIKGNVSRKPHKWNHPVSHPATIATDPWTCFSFNI